MPITAWTFIVAWLAIAGVPPFAGFWSKDEILANAWDKSPILWAIGLVTALLTAYYMSRQVFLVFFGEERWRHAADPHTAREARAEPEHEPAAVKAATGDEAEHAAAGARAAAGGDRAHGDFRPHESPPVMAIPLVVLAVLSAIGGALNLPFGGTVLEHWLHPVFGDRLHELTLGTGAKVGFAAIATVAALIGIGIGYAVYLRHRVRAFEPSVLQHAWYVDAAYAKVVGEGGRDVATVSAEFDAKVIDGAVNGVAAAVRAGGGRLRTIQTGFVRNYALAVAIGAVGILAYVVTRS
jgi:NADH-quinone oxidoreductase subunit L